MSTPDPRRGLDLAELTRLANELFRGGPVTSASLAVPPQDSPPVSSFPLDAHLPPPRDLPPSVAASAPTTPTFYFMEQARGLSRAVTPRPLTIDAWLDDPWAAAASVPALRPGLGNWPSKSPGFDVNAVRRDFPILDQEVNGRPLVWLDNAATTQKPRAVIERLSRFYETENSNIHRAAHELAARASDAYEQARETVRRFLVAESAEEIVFVRGATEAINLVSQSWGRSQVGRGDEIVISHLEHHANIVPWQRLAEERGARLRIIPVDEDGQISLSEYAALLGPRTKLVSITHVSNALGTVTPVKTIVEMAHAVGARVLVDGAQAVSHIPVNVQTLGADFYVFSGHKVFAPTGIGVLYGRRELLEEMQPWQSGGNMIQDVTFDRTIYQGAPQRFEAGTGNIADAVGLGAALDYVMRLGMPLLAAYEHELLVYGTHVLENVPGLRIVGTAAEKAGVLSFVVDGFRTDEISHELNEYGIAVRGGHHCAQPILRRFGLESTVRPSLAFYNTCAELDVLADAVSRITGPRGKSAGRGVFRSGHR